MEERKESNWKTSMSSNYFFLLTLLVCLILEPAPIAAQHQRVHLHLRHIQRTTNLPDSTLIQKACHGIGDYESDCISALQSAAPHQKVDPNELAFFILRFVEDHAANLSSVIKKAGATPNLDPLLQSAMNDCMDQYNPLDDLIEDAINAVLANAHSDAQKFIEAAISDVDVCHSQLKTSFSDVKTSEEDVMSAKDIDDYNSFLKKMLSAALNMVKSN